MPWGLRYPPYCYGSSYGNTASCPRVAECTYTLLPGIFAMATADERVGYQVCLRCLARELENEGCDSTLTAARELQYDTYFELVGETSCVVTA